MCVVSMITDHYIDKWKQRTVPDQWQGNQPYNPLPIGIPQPVQPNQPDWGRILQQQPQQIPQPLISQEEVAEFKKLLERAREYDARNNEPLCELQEKKDTLMKLAKQLGVEINFL